MMSIFLMLCLKCGGVLDYGFDIDVFLGEIFVKYGVVVWVVDFGCIFSGEIFVEPGVH